MFKITAKEKKYIIAARKKKAKIIWKKIGTKPFKNAKKSKNHDNFKGKATLYSATNAGKVRYGVVISNLKVDEGKPIQLMSGGSGYVAEAIKKAFNLRARLGSAKAVYTDWGKPIGQPSLTLRTNKPTLVFF